MSKHNNQQRHFQKLSQVSLAVALGFTVATSIAGNLNLSDNALEVVIGVESNIMILTDDSGSMDWSMSTSEDNGIAHMPAPIGLAYFYTHPAPSASGAAPGLNAYTWVIATEEHLDVQGVTAPYGGVWRYWNSDYNKIYYNPDVTYEPWAGVDSSGNNFANATPDAALYNPYDASQGNLDLTAITTYDTDCGLAECAAIPALNGVFTVADFYPARYYTWPDTNATTAGNAGNGVVNENDDHTLVRIQSSTATYTGRLAYDETAGTGRSDCTDTGGATVTCTYAEEIQNFANWFSYYRKRDLTAKAAFSHAIKPADSSRIGYATINNKPLGNTANNLGVASMNISPASGNKRALLDTVFSTSPAGGTPLREAFRDTVDYFDCASDDILGSAASSAAGSSSCPVEAAPAGQCQQNYTVLMTDGYWNGSDPLVGGGPTGSAHSSNNIDDDGGDYAGGAFSDTYNDTLADIAMYYYKNDLHSLDDDVPATARDISRYRGTTDPFETMHQHMATYTVGFGVDGALTGDPSGPDVTFAWPDPYNDDAGAGTTSDMHKIDDLRHAAYNGRGQFLNAANPVELANAMDDIFSDIASSTGTATAVAFNTQEVESGTLVFRASFNTKTNEGDLVAQNVNADGSIDDTIIWSAAEELDSKVSADSDTRTIITYQNNGDSTSGGVPFQWADLNATQQALLNAPQPANIAVGTNTFGDERLEHLRGQSQYEGTNYDSGEFRERADVAGRLGDIVHSTPVFVGKPEFLGRTGGVYPSTVGSLYTDYVEAQQDRLEVTYTGANDGMLHGIDTTDGSELFAYIPNILMSELSDLTDPDYAHRYYVDLSPAVNDVYFTPASGTNSSSLSWNTILIGGLNAGGKGYYALNVTDPTDLDSESEAKENVMWEFTEADDGGVGSSDLGYTFSQPIIAMTNAEDGSGNKVWVAIFGNGYNSTSTDGDSALYILRIDGGQDGVWSAGSDFLKISTGNGKAESSDGTTPNGIGGVRAIDSNGDGTVDYVYAGDLQGNLYRFDMTSTTATSWVTAPKTLFQARYKASDGFSRDIIQPITTSPIVVTHPEAAGEFIVIAATGSWMTTDDATSTDIQSIYGVWDDLSTNPEVTMSSTSNQLVEQVFTNYTNLEHGFTVRTLTNNAVAWADTGNASNQVKGWYIDLDVIEAGGSDVEYPGERATRNLQLRGGILFVNTVIPKDVAACSVGTGGYELAIDPTTGGSGTEIIFDISSDGSFGDEDNVGDGSGAGNIVTGIKFDGGTPSDAAFIGSRRMTQVGDEIRSFDTNTSGSPNTGRTSWREITQ